MKKYILTTLSFCLVNLAVSAQTPEPLTNGTEIKSLSTIPEFTVAGSLATPERKIFNLNVGWRFLKADDKSATSPNFNDSKWEIVNLPHGLEALPESASGGINYQGVSCYRKHFSVPNELKGKRVTLYFEGAMGKSEIFVNGKKVRQNFGGYLPISIDVSNDLKYGEKNIIVVKTDNSNDDSYPPGKPQDSLDFCYFGGIYRDVFLIATNDVFITNANDVADQNQKPGVFLWTKSIDKKSNTSTVGVRVHMKNQSAKNEKILVNVENEFSQGKLKSSPINLAQNSDFLWEGEIKIPTKETDLWSTENPVIKNFTISLENASGKRIDSIKIPFGIRSVEITDKGFWVNGEKFPERLIGANRHQDFAELGNAVPNNLQWQDAVKLRAAGLRIVRCAHYPMDPAFMDACNRLGLFVIVATPGWQFWNNKAPFEERVYSDITQMVRRDRNHPSVLMWEPILNESYYPQDFAQKSHNLVHTEYPGPGCYTACDQQSKGSQHYDVMYSHPITGNPVELKNAKQVRPGKPYFCREFGDNVDSWFAHNSPSRVSREWGEIPQLIQAKHYLKPDYQYTCWDSLFKAPAHHFGGALWHPFDHQRGYHPDPFYGGIMDSFRQNKLSYFGFMAQRPNQSTTRNLGSGPMVKIAHSATPFSPQDVTVFSNCEEVRLISQTRPPVTQKVIKNTPEKPSIPNEPIVFEKAWDFQKSKEITRAHREKATSIDSIVAEGLIGGKVVCRDIVQPSRRPSGLKLELDNHIPLEADGSTVAVLVASVVDENGIPKRLNGESIVLEILSGDARFAGENERKIEWGTAPFLLHLGTQPGEIVVQASLKYPGSQKAKSTQLKLTSVKSGQHLLFTEQAKAGISQNRPNANIQNSSNTKPAKNLKEVEAAQEDFE